MPAAGPNEHAATASCHDIAAALVRRSLGDDERGLAAPRATQRTFEVIEGA